MHAIITGRKIVLNHYRHWSRLSWRRQPCRRQRSPPSPTSTRQYITDVLSYIGYECQSASNTRSPYWRTKFCDTAPRFLGPLDRVADLHGRRALHSASSSRLVVPMFRLSTVGSRTFNVSRPRIWNGLPEDVVSAPTFSSFRRRLKPFLFQQSYPDIII